MYNRKIVLDDLICDGETVIAYALANSYRTYYCISMEDSDDIAKAIENTLHRLLDAGVDNACIAEITGLCNRDGMTEENSEGFMDIDLGYMLPGNLVYCNEMGEEWKSYTVYRSRWLAAHGIGYAAREYIDSEFPFSELYGACETLFGSTWPDFAEYRGRKNIGILPDIPKDRGVMTSVMTPEGTISATVMSDPKYPGICLEYEGEDGCPGAVLEYSPTAGCVQLRVYGKDDPDGDPLDIYQIEESLSYMSGAANHLIPGMVTEKPAKSNVVQLELFA